MIHRTLTEKLLNDAGKYPVVTVTGPRQSGKTTLVKNVFPQYKYVSLEDPDQRSFALDDPKGFLREYKSGVILDEVQRTPDLLSYIQTIVDEHNQSGQFILTGSQNFLLIEKISQSLSGRTAIHNLLPFSKRELFAENPYPPSEFPTIQNTKKSYPDLWEMLLTGFYPRIHDKGLVAHEWLADYYQTYIERDVRTILNIGDLDTFGKFLRLCAGRVGQLVNFSSLAADCGISNMTAKRWLSVLRSSFIIMPIQPHFENFSKRLIKSPKLYFLDTGLLSFLLGIKERNELRFHAHKGAIFESFVFSEMYKLYINSGLIPYIYYWHDVKRHEIDFVIEQRSKLLPIEVKSGETITSDQFSGLNYYYNLAGDKSEQPILIYAGEDSYVRNNIQVLSWQNI